MSTATGRLAESAAAEYLVQRKFEIIDRNWRRRSCEIDIIAISKQRFLRPKSRVVYFVEVKYRGSAVQGDGLAYITTSKQKQMRYAANVWMNEHDWRGDARLVVISLSATPPCVDAMIELD